MPVDDRDIEFESATEEKRYEMRVQAERALRRLDEKAIDAGPPTCVKCGRPSLAWGRCIEHLADQARSCPESRVYTFFVAEDAGRALAKAAAARGVSTSVIAAEVVEAWAREN